MKEVVYFVIALVLLISASALTDPSRADFTALEISCNATANLQINISHSGINIFTKDIRLVATHFSTNTSVELTNKGLWSSGFIGSDPINQTGNDFDEYGTFRFFSDPLLTSSGEYYLHVEWPGGIQDWQTRLDKAFVCPGINCISNSSCDPSQKCSAGKCEYIACSACDVATNHRCSPKCDDSDPCTQDACGENGNCLHVKAENCCGFDDQCNDNKNCTTDRCMNNKCVNEPAKCPKTLDPCVIGVCTDNGCAYTTDQKCQLRHKSVFFRFFDWFTRIFS